jgi:preprotein translocase subunit SecE
MEKIDRAKEFLTEARAEIKKVAWPTRQQTIQATWVVVAMVIVMAVFFGLVDLGLSTLVRHLIR